MNLTAPGPLLAALQYHVIVGRTPVMSQTGQPLLGAGDKPVFLPTLLNNASYTNVTGGQRVEHLFTDRPVYRSGLQQVSAVITAVSIIYLKG